MGFVATPKASTPGSEDWLLYAQRFQHFLLVNGIIKEFQNLHLLFEVVGNSMLRLLTDLRQLGKLAFKKASWRVISNPSLLKIVESANPVKRSS